MVNLLSHHSTGAHRKIKLKSAEDCVSRYAYRSEGEVQEPQVWRNVPSGATFYMHAHPLSKYTCVCMWMYLV